MHKTAFFFFFSFSQLFTFGQQKDCLTIAEAFKMGDVASIETYFPNNLDMTVVDTEDVFSKVQAGQILNQFFKKNIPSYFIIKHQGGSPGSDNYIVGTLKTNNGDFRVTFFVRKDQNEVKLKRLRIETTEVDF